MFLKIYFGEITTSIGRIEDFRGNLSHHLRIGKEPLFSLFWTPSTKYLRILSAKIDLILKDSSLKILK